MNTSLSSRRIAYIAVVILILPFIIVHFVTPEWVARIVVSIYVQLVLLITFCWLALDARIKLLRKKSVGAQLYGKTAMENVELFIRGLLLVMVVLLIKGWSIGTVEDVMFLLSARAPLQFTDTIVEVRQDQYSCAGICDQNFWVKGRPNDPWNIYFHYPPLEQGKTYQFLYVPHTEAILEAREVTQ